MIQWTGIVGATSYDCNINVDCNTATNSPLFKPGTYDFSKLTAPNPPFLNSQTNGCSAYNGISCTNAGDRPTTDNCLQAYKAYLCNQYPHCINVDYDSFKTESCFQFVTEKQMLMNSALEEVYFYNDKNNYLVGICMKYNATSTTPEELLEFQYGNVTSPYRHYTIKYGNLTITQDNSTLQYENSTLQYGNLTIPFEELTIHFTNISALSGLRCAGSTTNSYHTYSYDPSCPRSYLKDIKIKVDPDFSYGAQVYGSRTVVHTSSCCPPVYTCEQKVPEACARTATNTLSLGRIVEIEIKDSCSVKYWSSNNGAPLSGTIVEKAVMDLPSGDPILQGMWVAESAGAIVGVSFAYDVDSSTEDNDDSGNVEANAYDTWLIPVVAAAGVALIGTLGWGMHRHFHKDVSQTEMNAIVSDI